MARPKALHGGRKKLLSDYDMAVCYSMFLQGKTVQQIAWDKQVSESTVRRAIKIKQNEVIIV